MRIVSVKIGIFDGFSSMIIICCSYKIDTIRFAYRHGVRSLGNKFMETKFALSRLESVFFVSMLKIWRISCSLIRLTDSEVMSDFLWNLKKRRKEIKNSLNFQK